MLRFELSERDRGPLPVIDTDDEVVIIGSAVTARIRLPVEVAQPEHVRLAGQTWTLLAASRIDGMARAAGDSGPIGHGTTFELGDSRVRVTIAPAHTRPTSSQRTESLARELVRGLLGEGAAPWLEIERGTGAGTRRALPPPEARVVIGRGDEASWVIFDEDLSRSHAEIVRGWDGTSVADLGSKNGTRLDGVKLGTKQVPLHDGALLALGELALRFHDPAERHLRGEPLVPAARIDGRSPPHAPRVGPGPSVAAPSLLPFLVYAAIAGLATAGLIWVLAS